MGVCNNRIENPRRENLFGMKTDNKLKIGEHYGTLCKTIGQNINILTRISSCNTC